MVRTAGPREQGPWSLYNNNTKPAENSVFCLVSPPKNAVSATSMMRVSGFRSYKWRDQSAYRSRVIIRCLKSVCTSRAWKLWLWLWDHVGPNMGDGIRENWLCQPRILIFRKPRWLARPFSFLFRKPRSGLLAYHSKKEQSAQIPP